MKAAGQYGATARVPVLWLYTANDSFFEPDAGAPHGRGLRRAPAATATFTPLGPFGDDGHTLAGSDSGDVDVAGPVCGFLASLR